jgi:hypothetical protein
MAAEPDEGALVVTVIGTASSTETSEGELSSLLTTTPNKNYTLQTLNRKMNTFNDRMVVMNNELIHVHRVMLVFMVR